MPNTTHVITQSGLGTNGRFGNQVLQYAFQRIVARQAGMSVQTPAWFGQYLFGHDDPPVTLRGLPLIAEGRDFPEAIFPAELLTPPPGSYDLFGFFQFHSSHLMPFREFYRSLFRPVPAIAKPLKHALDQLRAKGGNLVGLHLRRGDFGQGPFFVAPTAWYLDFLQNIWPRLLNPVLFIASDESEKVIGDFEQFHPVTCSQLGLDLPQAPFYPDFFLLTQCDMLAISNSTYSFAAAMLNERGGEFWRPELYQKKLIAFEPWNSLPLLHRELGKPMAETHAEIERQARETLRRQSRGS